ncbi:flagellar hook assembly protein FlgD [Thermaerobacillus caldiproteolyticus]|uniref:Flagellar basal-body rod modification protein FlgD n=1 Tax=Thermaerobacillus caldiproteolyticus TaxID=247480 RepID=A0A7V9Z4U9_9BACL|nr:flagellar hook assembly protein FlgD [Anoxybacillus caldiproteolyticus]MBA2873988.1 flagellar basal-body rod modification protein FlgD [Anoxybacillus caldiproteolyticus]
MANTIDSSLLLSNYKPPERQTGNQILGKDDFLKILLVQLQNQDPLNPMEDKEFIAQMASFSTLEQITNMATELEQFIQLQNENAILRYSEMIGKKVYWEEDSDETDTSDTPTSGIVKSVLQKNNEIFLELEDGKMISGKQIIKVETPTEEIR